MRFKGIFGKKAKNAFTLLELLVVIAIIMLLGGLLFPAFSVVRDKAKQSKAKADVKQLDIAWKAVLLDYRDWGTAAAGPKAGAMPSVGSSQQMNNQALLYLQGGNSKGVVYMEFDKASTNSVGYFVDPWYNNSNPADCTHAYMIFLGNGSVTPSGAGTIYRDIAAWSLGKDAVSGTRDDVTSW